MLTAITPVISSSKERSQSVIPACYFAEYTMSTPRSTPSPLPVLPPIIASEKDRDFLVGLNGFIDKELAKIERDNPEQRYIVYKSAFDRVKRLLFYRYRYLVLIASL